MNNRNTVIHVGVTGNIQKRMFEHKHKLCEGFTKRYNVDKLVHIEIFDSPLEAIKREKELKGWTRKKKDQLILRSNPSLRDLYQPLF